jgi:hypothetical protein
MRERTMLLTSAGLGVATAYLLDPSSGNRRRRRIGDALVHAAHETTDAVSTVGRDLRNRTRGIVASARRTKGGPWRSRMKTWLDIQQRNWAPATRAIVGTSGAALIVVGARRRDWTGLALAAVGSALFARAVTNLEFRRLVGIGAGRRAIDLVRMKTLETGRRAHDAVVSTLNAQGSTLRSAES